MSETSLFVGFIEVLKKFTTTALNLSLSAGKRRNACYSGHLNDCTDNVRNGRTILVNNCPRIRISSSYTSWQHLRAGSSRRLICCLTITSKAVVPTKSEGVEPYTRISVQTKLVDRKPHSRKSYTESSGYPHPSPGRRDRWSSRPD